MRKATRLTGKGPHDGKKKRQNRKMQRALKTSGSKTPGKSPPVVKKKQQKQKGDRRFKRARREGEEKI